MSRAARALSASSKVIRAGLTPSLVSYFFWICAICFIYGAWIAISIADVTAYLCNIPAQENESLGYTVGCANCTDKLMLCDKGACWRYAFNITYQEDAKTPDDAYYKTFQRAVLDQACNDLALTSDNPVIMLEEVINSRASTTPASPSESCLSLTCRVLTRAVMRQLGTDLAGPPSPDYPPADSCTNAKSTKFDWEADDCVCNSLTVTMLQADQFQTACGGMALGLKLATHERILSTKTQCYQRGMTFAKNALGFAELYAATIVDTACSTLLQNSESPHDWLIQRNRGNLAVPDYCRRVMCAALVSTAFDNNNNNCNWTQDAIQEEAPKRLTRSRLEAIDAFCNPPNEARMPISEKDFCTNDSANPPNPMSFALWSPLCRGEDVSGAYSTAQAGGRRLEPVTSSFVRRRTGQSAQNALAQQRRSVRPRAQMTHASLQQAVVGVHGLEDTISEADSGDSCGGSGRVCDSAIQRKLQAAAAAPAPSNANNDQLQEYATTPWSKCTCYQQCIDGVQTRTVSCPPGVTCKEPKPTDAVACSCGHCSDCKVLMFIYVTAGGYGFIGLVSLLLWAAFLSISSLEEDDYTDMRMGIKCVGCICRALPSIIKVMTYVNLACVIIVVTTALVPIGDAFSDCKNSPVFRTLAIGGVVVFLFQLALGIYMHRNKPMPPWLHSASSSKVMKILCKPLKCIGP